MAREHQMIEPFVDDQVRQGVISYGVSSYGYDVRVGDEFKVFTNVYNTVVDPKNFDPKSFVDIKADVCIIPPNSFALASTIEYFRIPRDVLTVCLGKSTYARCGIIVNVTPFEPEWEGHVTIEISNTTPLPAKIYANEGIAQVLFFQSDEPCARSYKDKKGKYQAQRGVTLPKLVGEPDAPLQPRVRVRAYNPVKIINLTSRLAAPYANRASPMTDCLSRRARRLQRGGRPAGRSRRAADARAGASTRCSTPSQAGQRGLRRPADRELDRRQHPPQLRPAARAHAADRRRGRAAGHPPPAGAAGRDARRPAARLLASAGAGAVRAVPAHADQASRSSPPTTPPAAPRWSPTAGSKDAAAIASARAGEVFGLVSLAASVQDFDDNITRFLVVGRAPLPNRVRRQDLDRLLAAERAGRRCSRR